MDLNKGDATYVTDKSIHSQATSKNSGLDYFEPNDCAAEKRLLRKLDLRVVPIIAFLYTLAFLDRINIGNARIQGLEKDLHMKGQDFNIALMIFFIPYILFEVPSNLLVRKIAPSTWLSTIMVLWGKHSFCSSHMPIGLHSRLCLTRHCDHLPRCHGELWRLDRMSLLPRPLRSRLLPR